MMVYIIRIAYMYSPCRDSQKCSCGNDDLILEELLDFVGGHKINDREVD